MVSYKDFALIIEILKRNKVKLSEIAEYLKLYGKDNKTINLSVLTKLTTGVIKTNKGRGYEEYISLLEKKYHHILSDRSISTVEIDFSYLLFFWDKAGTINFSLVLLSTSSDTKGRVIYFKKNEDGKYVELESLEIKSFFYKDSETLDIIFKDTKRSGFTFVSIHKGNKRLDEINLSFCSYSGSMESTQTPFAGIGIVKQINIGDIEKEIDFICHNGIDSQVTNVLYERRMDVKDHEVKVIANYDELIDKNRDPQKIVAGVWVGYFLRNEIDMFVEGGGIVTVVMRIKESGEATIVHFLSKETKSPEKIIYRGIIRFPIDNQTTIMLGNFEKKNDTHRLSLYLRTDSQKLKGMFTGWRVTDTTFFATPIYFTRITNDIQNESQFEQLLQDIKPTRSHFNEFIKKEVPDVINQLGKIQENSFATIESALKLKPPNQQYLEFVIYKNIRNNDQVGFKFVGICNSDSRVFLFQKNRISFEYLQRDDEIHIKNDYKETQLFFKMDLEKLNTIITPKTITNEYSINVSNEKDRYIFIIFKPLNTYLSTELVLDKNEKDPHNKSLHSDLFNFFTPYFNLMTER
jgi:hypothetical protein